MNRDNINVNEVLRAYFAEAPTQCTPYGNGHINDTFLVTADKKYLIQRINTAIFTKPAVLMANIMGITSHIRAKVRAKGNDATRASLVFLPTLAGEYLFRDRNGLYWRMCAFCEHTVTKERIQNAQDFYTCGRAFGEFQQQLADYPTEMLTESIKSFHNTSWRYENLMQAVEADAAGRLKDVLPEVEFVRERKEFCQTLERAKNAGTLPLRVTHNDTKLNNILFDEHTGEPVCIIDLDTVMPGYAVNDFGDAIRFGASTAAEDETDLSKVALDLTLFRAFAKGFIEGCDGSLTDEEIALFPIGAIMMTLECGMRFLTDHLEGDVYFRIHREGHNLDRAKNQFALVRDMESKLSQMQQIIRELTDK